MGLSQETSSTGGPEPLQLPVGGTERHLAAGETHAYSVTLEAGDALLVSADQREIEVHLLAFSPTGEKLIETESLADTRGLEQLFWIAEFTGSYRIEVHAAEALSLSGQYVLESRVRPASPEDWDRLEAQRLTGEANGLLREKTPAAAQKALEKLGKALVVWNRLGDRINEAYTRDGIAHAQYSGQEIAKSLEQFWVVLDIWRELGDATGQARALNDIASVYYTLSDNRAAVACYEEALPLHRSAGDRPGEVRVLLNLANVLRNLDENQEALELIDEAGRLCEAIGDRWHKALALIHMAGIYQDYGQSDTALSYYRDSLAIGTTLGDRFRHWEGRTHYFMGRVFRDLGDYAKAIEMLQEGLGQMQAQGDKWGETEVLSDLGRLHLERGEPKEALDEGRRGLVLAREIEYREGEATSLTNLGQAELALGDASTALQHLRQALVLHRAAADRPGEAKTLYEIARAERAAGDLEASRRSVEEAAAVLEVLRTRVASPSLRVSYLAVIHKVFDLDVDVLMSLHAKQPDRGFDREAFKVAERARARALLELLTEPRTQIHRGVEGALLERERETRERLESRLEAQMSLLERQHSDEEAAAAKHDVFQASSELEQVEGQIRAKSPHYAALTQPTTLAVEEVQKDVLDANSVLLEYALGQERSFLWAVTRDTLRTYILPSRGEIEGVARRLYNLLGARNLRVRFEPPAKRAARVSDADRHVEEAARALGRLVLDPARADLEGRHVLVVPDGALQYLPFGLLTLVPVSASKEGRSRSLFESHEIVQLPSASVLAVLRRETAGRASAPKLIAAFADPVFEREDERLRTRAAKTGHPGEAGARPPILEAQMVRAARETGFGGARLSIPRLPFTRREARAILALVPPQSRLEATGFGASLAAATSPGLADFRYIHFATHGLLDSIHPELSGLLLSRFDAAGVERDGFLTAAEVFNLNLPADLVVLSGCRTALGKEIQGEGLMGLTRAFFYAGAVRLLVSLWDVQDEATAELMTRFYRGLLREGKSPAAALRSAQLSMARQSRWRSPYYWAAFVLQGEPR